MSKSNFVYENNFSEARSKIESAGNAGILAALLTIERYAKNYSRKASGATRDSYSHETQQEGTQLIGAVGSDMMNAVYEEYGTGEFAENGDGRKGGWVYYNAKDDEFYFTYGKKPNKPLRRAAQVSRSEVQKLIMGEFEMEFRS